MENLRSTKYCYPTVDIWYISFLNNRSMVLGYSFIAPTQCLGSISDDVEYYTQEEEWVKVLEGYGINPFPPDEKID